MNSLFYIRYKFWFILCQLRYQGDVLSGATVTLYCLPSLLFTIKAETLIQPYLPATALLCTLSLLFNFHSSFATGHLLLKVLTLLTCRLSYELITVLCSVVARDLAISPGIQDPSLNTAECVIQGHQSDIDAREVSSYIRAILYCSLFSVVLIGPILGFFSLAFFGYDPAKKDRFNRCEKRQREPERPAPAQRPSNIRCECNCCCCNGRFFGCYKTEDPFMRPAKYQGHPTRI